MRRSKRLLLLSIIFSTVFTAFIFGQDTGGTEVYIDQLFNNYVEIEDSLLGKDEITSQELRALRRLRVAAEDAGRRDILSRIEMLEFIAKTINEQNNREADPEAVLAGIRETENQRRQERKLLETGRTAKAASIATAAVSGSLYLTSSILYDKYYSKYTNSEYADQAAFFLFWWQFFEQVSIYSGLTTIAASAAAGILNAVF